MPTKRLRLKAKEQVKNPALEVSFPKFKLIIQELPKILAKIGKNQKMRLTLFGQPPEPLPLETEPEEENRDLDNPEIEDSEQWT